MTERETPPRCECGAAILPGEKKCWLCNSVQSNPQRAATQNEYYADHATQSGRKTRLAKTITWLAVCAGFVFVAGLIVAQGDMRPVGAIMMLFAPPLVLTGAFGALMIAVLPGPDERGGCMFAAVMTLFLPAAFVAWVFILCSGNSFH